MTGAKKTPRKLANNTSKNIIKGPPRKSAKKGFAGTFILVLILGLMGAFAWRGWQWWTWASAAPVPAGATASAKTVKLQIAQGTSAQEIGRDLEALGIINSATAWNLWTRWLTFRDPQGGFKAGTYQLSSTQSMETIATRIWSGEVVHGSFTIPEGWSLKQMATYFEEQGFFSAQDFLTAANQFSTEQYSWLPKPHSSNLPRLEGYLFPDTYQIDGKPAPNDILKQMLNRFEQVALPLYQEGRTRPL